MLPQVFCRLLESVNLLKVAKYTYNRFKYSCNLPLQQKNAEFRRKAAAKNLVLPPARLTFLVRWKYDLQDYYESGQLGYSCIVNTLERNGFDPEKLNTILDFGCGCARILRHWKRSGVQRLYGVDYNRDLIDWCRDALPIGQFDVNGLESKLDFDDRFFDFIYASSVFTHLDERLQHFWMSELIRVLKNGALLLITTMSDSRLPQLSPTERKAYDAGQIVIQSRRFAGTNVCGAFHPKAYVVNQLAKGLKLIEFMPGGAKDHNQDIYLFQKRE